MIYNEVSSNHEQLEAEAERQPAKLVQARIWGKMEEAKEMAVKKRAFM